jgi:hypothetical protein
LEEENTQLYSDNNNIKVKKPVNKIIDYTLGKKRLKG